MQNLAPALKIQDESAKIHMAHPHLGTKHFDDMFKPQAQHADFADILQSDAMQESYG